MFTALLLPVTESRLSVGPALLPPLRVVVLELDGASGFSVAPLALEDVLVAEPPPWLGHRLEGGTLRLLFGPSVPFLLFGGGGSLAPGLRLHGIALSARTCPTGL
jgi:hypothetical protein